MFPFPSDLWIKELMTKLNESPAYQTAAARWEGDFAFIVETAEGSTISLYMDLWRGTCRDAYQIAPGSNQTPAFTLTTSRERWQEVLTGQLDPLKGIAQRKLALTGNKIKVLQNRKAALAMVAAAQTIPTDW